MKSDRTAANNREEITQ